MTNHCLIRADVEQLLHEANCTEAFTQQFLTAMETDNIKNQLRLLRGQRMRQLERLHQEEDRLDRLDYLRYALEKQLPTAKKK